MDGLGNGGLLIADWVGRFSKSYTILRKAWLDLASRVTARLKRGKMKAALLVWRSGLKQKLRDYLVLFGIVAIILVLDQVTKSLVRNNLSLGETWMPWEWLAPYVRFIHWTNTGVAFGMFQGKGYIFSIFAVFVILMIIYYYPQIPRSDWALRLALSLQMSGAGGNLIDRITQQGHVTDFISVGNFAVFNIADSAITVGVGILILGIILQEIQARKEKKHQETEIQPALPVEDEICE